MTTSERSLVGIRGWLAVYLAWLYFGLLGFLTNIWYVWHGLSDILAVGHLVNDLRVVLALYIVVFCTEAVGIGMIHTRQPKTRQFFLIEIPVLFVLKLLRHHFESAIRAATAGHTLGVALSAVVQEPKPYYYLIWSVLISVSWLYWFRSERVKQTFAPMSSAVTPQNDPLVLRLFLVDAILLVPILYRAARGVGFPPCRWRVSG